MYSRQQSMIDLKNQMEEMHLQYEKQKDELKQRSDELSARFASVEISWTKSLSQGSSDSQIHIQGSNLSPSNTITTYPRPPQPPDPPDFNQYAQRLYKYEFPKFDGTSLREWFRGCDEYFSLHRTPPEMRVRVVSPHMIGKALQWHTNYIRNNFGIFPPWLDYIIAISAKFGDDDALPMPRAPFSPYQIPNNQSHYKSSNTTSLLPPPETTKMLPYKPNFPTETSIEKFSYTEMQERRTEESGVVIVEETVVFMSPTISGNAFNGPTFNSKELDCELVLEMDERQARKTKEDLRVFDEEPCTQDHQLKHKQPHNTVQECEDASMSGDEGNHNTNSVLEKEMIPSSAWCQRISATQPRNNNVTQQEELIHDTETMMETGLIQEHESLVLTDSVLDADCVHPQESFSQFKVPLSSLEPSRRCHNESLDVVDDLPFSTVTTHRSHSQFGLKCVTSNAHREFDIVASGTKKLKNRRTKMFSKTWWFKFKTSLARSILMWDKLSFVEESSEEDITELKAYHTLLEAQQGLKIHIFSDFDLEAWIGLIIYGCENKKHMLLLVKQANRVWERGGLLATHTSRKWLENCYEPDRALKCYFQLEMSFVENVEFKAYRKELLVAGFMQLTPAGLSLHLKHKWRSKLLQSFSRLRFCMDSNCALVRVEYLVWQQQSDKFVFGAVHWAKFKRILRNGSSKTVETTKAKQNLEKNQGGSLLELLKRHEARVDMVMVPYNSPRVVKFIIEQSEKPLATFLSYAIFHSPRPLKLSCCKEDKESSVSRSEILRTSNPVKRNGKSFVMMLFTIAESLILLSDLHILVSTKGTEVSIKCRYEPHSGLDFTANVTFGFGTFMEEFSSVCKFLLCAFVLNLIDEHSQDSSFFGLISQWKDHPPDHFFKGFQWQLFILEDKDVLKREVLLQGKLFIDKTKSYNLV